mmetsp:Transcript_96592/g.273073  ORF Transcript_96592/g.273073 Transcript_96592/m.273073 type:complete len:413 (+) Transcript_96592:153-1391(+)
MGTSASRSKAKATSEDEVLAQIAQYFQQRGFTVQQAFDIVFDTDRSGFVTWDEFSNGVNLCTQNQGLAALSTSALWRTFKRYDTSGDGKINLREMEEAMRLPTTVSHPVHHYRSDPGRPPSVVPLHGEQLMKKTATGVIARIASAVKRNGFKPADLFNRMDVDQSHTLTRPEVETLVLTFAPDLSRTELEAIFLVFDKDNNHQVDLNEFCRALQEATDGSSTAVEDHVRLIGDKVMAQGCDMTRTFRMFDRDLDNYLTRDDWQRLVQLFAPSLSTRDAEAVFSRFDTNCDGFLGIMEFQEFYDTAVCRRQPAMQTGVMPTYVPHPVEADWETEILNQVRDTLNKSRAGMTISQVFRRLDVRHTGTLTPYEFRRLVSAARPHLSEPVLDSLFKKVNVSNTGAITLSEFIRRFG